MVDTGVVAREMIVFIGPERRRNQLRRRVSPPTSAVYHPIWFCPSAPFFAMSYRRYGALFVFAFLSRASDFTQRRRSGYGLRQVEKRLAQQDHESFVSRVTTPAPKGAFFNDEEGSGYSPLPHGRRKRHRRVSFLCEEVA